MTKNQPFKALSRICLNNWHYIDKRILTLSHGINFFTGHSGSGKSTVIDALQIVLYANTDGRGFFNKAAADDSDRSLIEYLRGMVNISDNNESEYLRNKNFSSTIVLELEQTNTKEKQCVGVIFDVETATNEISRLFFWHKGALLDNHYRSEKRCLSTLEMKEYLQRMYKPEEYYCGPSNERFRKQLYDIYLGGLDMEKFPRLFKRAIPFRMNIKLEDFVKEYICMEQDIQIEDMQESVMQYGRMRNKIEGAQSEIHELKEIRKAFDRYQGKEIEIKRHEYLIGKLEMLQLKDKIQELQDRLLSGKEEISQQEKGQAELEQALRNLNAEYEEIIRQIERSGYDRLQTELFGINEVLERLEVSKTRWEQSAAHMALWKEKDITPNQTLWDIDRFCNLRITEGELERLKESLQSIREDVESERQDATSDLRDLKKSETVLKEELKELKQGKKAYPRELEEARYELRNRLHETCGKFVNVQILADLIDVKDENWHQAVEGYMGSQKLALIVEPAYAKAAMKLYQELDRSKYHGVAVLDTKRVMEENHTVQKRSLAEEVTAKEPYVRAYIDFLLGNVMKCETTEELRACKIGITKDCILYHSFRMQYINPKNYTRRAFIGEASLRQRVRRLEEKRLESEEKRKPLEAMLVQIKEIQSLEYLSQPVEEYMRMLGDIHKIREKEKQKQVVEEKLEALKLESVDELKAKKDENLKAQHAKKVQLEQTQEQIWSAKNRMKEYQALHLEKSEELAGKERFFKTDTELETDFVEFINCQKSGNCEYMRNRCVKQVIRLEEEKNACYQQLVDVRGQYLRQYPGRTFSASTVENTSYDQLLNELECDQLVEFQEAAKVQARLAVEHFKDDFIFKIRSAIREAYQRKEELNRMISKLNFGKDKYQFVITKNKGPDGEYYKMFMDDSLQINPTQLGDAMENQLDLFTMEHEQNYGDMMNDLIQIFIPPEHATVEELEEAKRNMDKYSDYRTYLSFDMQQIVKGEKDLKIGLSKMIKKNSGGEGQNPLYVALLASFAQVYRINLSPKLQRNPSLRLVVLDEAFSKMDAEKVASCIELIRGLGFQSIISATNDKIQNYLENVDKTFVYANPNKRHISIQEFEKQEFAHLKEEQDEAQEDRI